MLAAVWMGWGLLASAAHAGSIQEDANGFVVIESEDYDFNLTQDGGEWQFSNGTTANDGNPLWGPFTGWGYMKGLGAGGTDMNVSPRLDYQVTFTVTGTHYLWVLGSDGGGKTVNMGLDGLVTTNSYDIGGEDGAFGPRDGGEWLWTGTNNTGTAQKWINKARLDVPSTGDHTVNLFINGGGTWVDKIVLTTNVAWRPEPFYTGDTVPPNLANGGATNIPTPVLLGSPTLAVGLTQPATGKVFTGGSNVVVTLAAKPVTNGVNSVTKIEFYARRLPSGPTTKIGQATALPYTVGWSNPPTSTNDLTAVVTDNRTPPGNVVTSAVATVQITPPAVYLTPLIWKTNNFDNDLGSWQLVSQNHASGFITNISEGWVFHWFFDLDWKNAALCGDSPGEFGGHVERMSSVAPYVGEKLGRRVSLNEELWFRGRGFKRNYGPNGTTPPATNRVDANGDSFIGYFDSANYSLGQPARIGLKTREPSNTYPSPSNWRMALASKPSFGDIQLGAIVQETNSFIFELHWVPSGNEDGSGTLSGTVAGTPFSQYFGPTTASFDAFGFVSVSQGSDEPWRQQDQYYDSMQYLVPASQTLQIQSLNSTQALLRWDNPDAILQYANGALPTSHTNASWVDISSGSYVNVGGWYYYTNTVGASTRWFQLRYPFSP